ncbi:MAG: NACHT domain-containing protein [Chloroflexi bacterium]|nr:NACHT domain-containing protein [Chloroflexota bacterium]
MSTEQKSETHVRGTNLQAQNDINANVGGDFVGRDQYKTVINNPVAPLPSADRQQRQKLIQNMRSSWIAGGLHASVHTTALLELGKEYQPEAVSRKWNRAMNADKPISQIFEDVGGNLLILGEPGSGKTITLLQLAESWLEKAEQDEQVPVPVVVDLSSWGQFRQQALDKGETYTLSRWLEEESLINHFQMPYPLTRRWLAEERLLLLLDGLDEVAEEARLSCIEAINQFKTKYSVGLVVCSRTADYYTLQKTLNLGHAIRLQPLTDAQIQTYLGDDPALATLREVLPHDETLQELATSPLSLSVMSLAYRDISADELDIKGDADGRLRHLYQRYVMAMFTRRPLGQDTPYEHSQAIHWLSNLAQEMQSHNQSMFYIDNLQPSWLPNKSRYVYYLLASIILGFLRGLAFGLFLVLFSYWIPWIGFWGLIIGWTISTLFLFMGPIREPIIPAHKIKLISRNSKQRYFGIFVSIISLIIVCLIPNKDWRILFLMIWFFASVLLFWKPQKIQHPKPFYPNQLIHTANKKMALISQIFPLAVGLLLTFFCGFIGWTTNNVQSIFILSGMGLSLSLAFLWFSINSEINGQVVPKHYVLRWVLGYIGILPQIKFSFKPIILDTPLVDFLNKMSDLNLLLKIGGGWKFIHPTFQKFFADRTGLSDK